MVINDFFPFPRAPCPWCGKTIAKITPHRVHFIGLGICPFCEKGTELSGVHSGLVGFVLLTVALAAAIKPWMAGMPQVYKAVVVLLIIYSVLWWLLHRWVSIEKYRYR